MNQISVMIANRLVEKLTEDLITNNEDPEETIGVVRTGSLQDNPLKFRRYVLVHAGRDPDDENWKDISAAFREEQLERRQYEVPAFEVGGPYGGTSWFRRGIVEWGLYGLREKMTRDETMEMAFSMQSKIERAIATASVAGLTDDFGETCMGKILPVWSNPEAGGGPKASFIWRGKVGYQALTMRDY